MFQATYANQLRKSRQKKKNAPTQKKITDMMHQPCTSTSRSPSMKRRRERLERDQSKMRKARALGLGEGQDHNNSK